MSERFVDIYDLADWFWGTKSVFFKKNVSFRYCINKKNVVSLRRILNRPEIMKMWIKYVIPAGIVIIAVLLYLFIPAINEWVIRMSKGWKGALFLGGIGVVLAVYYALMMGFRGRALGYAIAVIVFTAICIWLLANWDWFTEMLENHLGVWGMSGILILLALAVWICMHFLF